MVEATVASLIDQAFHIGTAHLRLDPPYSGRVVEMVLLIRALLLNLRRKSAASAACSLGFAWQIPLSAGVHVVHNKLIRPFVPVSASHRGYQS